VIGLALALLLSGAPAWAPAEGRELIGTRAPELVGLEWVQGGPLRLADLKGKAVLLRFWTAGCPYCTRSLPDLARLAERDAARGLVVLAIHHPKSEAGRDLAAVREAARALAPHLPVAQDAEWQTLRAYGVGSAFQAYTSVSVLVGPDGVIRWVHEGGELRQGSPAFDDLERTLEQLLPRR
jgi:peroxiredoxin